MKGRLASLHAQEADMLHKTEIFPEIMARITQRRGDPHLYSRFDPAKTALVVVDMQNCWVMEGQPGYTPYVPAIVPNINRVSTALRQAGGTVAWVQMNGSREVAAKWTRYRDFYANTEMFEAWADSLAPGNVGFELWAGLDVQKGDLVVEKNRFSALIQGASNLHAQLEARGVDTLLITGTATNVCCESTARDANMLNYKVVMVSDANCARSDVEHSAALSSLFGMFADVMTTDEVVSRLAPAARPQKAA
jgi:ureidoacrylate peracid hydrolase